MGDCPICLNDIKDIFTLKCNHVFCKECINKWLKVSSICPLCRNTETHTQTHLKWLEQLRPIHHPRPRSEEPIGIEVFWEYHHDLRPEPLPEVYQRFDTNDE